MKKTLLFPTPIWIDEFDEIDNKLLDEIKNQNINDFAFLEEYNKTGFHLSSIGGKRTISDMFLRDDRIKPLIKRINFVIDDISKDLNLYEQKLNLKNGWIFVTEKHDYHNYHVHPGTFISCVYYAKVPQNCQSKIMFRDPAYREKSAYTNNVSMNNLMYSQMAVPFEPKEGSFIAFPSWLEHAVTPSYSDEERVAIVFNYEVVNYESN